MKKSNSNCGFSLIEMSIVLLVMGLIVGGIMVGRNLIAAAEMREQVSELYKYKKAVKNFSDLYGGIPGDITNAVTLFGATTANGNGNGFVEASGVVGPNNTSPDNSLYDFERPHFFIQLNLAGLIEQKFDGTAVLGSGYPRNIMNPATGFFAAGPWGNGTGNTSYLNMVSLVDANLYLALNVVDPAEFGAAVTSLHNDGAGVFTPIEASEIDKKIDDSIPSTGKITAQSLNTTFACANATRYRLSSSDKICNLHYDLTD